MSRRTVLLVEDNPQDEALTLRAFSKAGITNQVVVTRDGAEALEYLFCTGAYSDRDPAIMPTVVLMDLNLPKISGLEVVRQIRENSATRLLPIVILTSSDEDEDRLKGYEFGANSYVRKPVEFSAFASAVQQVGLYWLILNELVPANIGTALPHEAQPADPAA